MIISHGKISSENVIYIAGQLDNTLTITCEDKKSVKSAISSNTAEEDTMSVIKSFNELCRVLRSLKSLPLSINAIQGINPVFRHTEVSKLRC